VSYRQDSTVGLKPRAPAGTLIGFRHKSIEQVKNNIERPMGALNIQVS